MVKIFDGHNDTLLAYYRNTRGPNNSFFEESSEGHIDFPRAKRGGFAGGFFALYASSEGYDMDSSFRQTETGYEFLMAPPRDRQGALQDAIAMASILFKIERESAGKFKVVRNLSELHYCLEHDIMAAILHIEGAEAIDTRLDTLELFYQAGLRSIGPVWSRQNAFGMGVPFSFPKHPDTGDGLTQAGKDMVKLCNSLGIMLDLSHITEKGFWDLAAISDAPLVATHSNAYALSASPRNLTDKQLAAIAETDGMVGLNYAVGFLREDGKPDENTPFETMLGHLDYLMAKLGEDRVGLGSDFDGARIPKVLGDVAGLPKLLAAMEQHGYGKDLIEKIAHKNWLRVLAKTWKA